MIDTVLNSFILVTVFIKYLTKFDFVSYKYVSDIKSRKDTHFFIGVGEMKTCYLEQKCRIKSFILYSRCLR